MSLKHFHVCLSSCLSEQRSLNFDFMLSLEGTLLMTFSHSSVIYMYLTDPCCFFHLEEL